jgi:hypothetical protein
VLELFNATFSRAEEMSMTSLHKLLAVFAISAAVIVSTYLIAKNGRYRLNPGTLVRLDTWTGEVSVYDSSGGAWEIVGDSEGSY